jgi:quercetin dioxygenase-like cupin family protein
MPFVNITEVKPVTLLPGWSGRFVHSQNLTLAYWEIADDAQSVHEHDHPQEEVWNVIEGEIEVTINGHTQLAGPGSVAVIPAGARHSVRVLHPSRVLVVDYPIREMFAHYGVSFPNNC